MRQFLRAYEPCESGAGFKRTPQPFPHTVLVFDTETDTDLKQRLRVGAYQLRVHGRLVARGVFTPDSGLSEFRAMLERLGTREGTAIVGFNLPFDIARVACDYSAARGSFDGGFSFRLVPGSRSRVRVKHLGGRKSLISWGGQPRPLGVFVDVATLGKSLLGRSHSLKTLAEALGTEARKLEASHGGEIDDAYLEYLAADVQVTWECYLKLTELWERYSLHHTHVSKVYSEASVGKAALREMNVRPLSEISHNITPEHFGAAMETFYGGRSEVHIRREPHPVVYVDFLSMYPTVCTLMGLWKYVTAERLRVVQSRANTTRVANLLRKSDLQTVLRKTSWTNLTTIVCVKPKRDMFPVRSDYSGAGNSIGLNYLSAAFPIWYTLADAIASKLLTGKEPEIVDAISLRAEGRQSDMEPWAVMGNREYMVDPNSGDFYRRLIELRATTTGDERQALKLVANSTCYGIFAELNERKTKPERREFVTGSGTDSATRNKVETPGLYHNPFLATFITGAARLMLATLETQVKGAGLEWLLCDTDSMAIVCPDDRSRSAVNRIVGGYSKTNPYAKPIQNVLKIEHGEHETVEAYAISAKRYCLFTRNSSGVDIVKASAHGLGHLRPPNPGQQAAGIADWLIPVWRELVRSDGIAQRPPRFRSAELGRPAMSQFTVTSPQLVRYGMEPYSFASVFRVSPACVWPHEGVAVAPFSRHASEAANGARLLGSGETVSPAYLITYADALREYCEHDESKFEGGDGRGVLRRRHVVQTEIIYIGKEGGRLEDKTVGMAGEDEPYKVRQVVRRMKVNGPAKAD